MSHKNPALTDNEYHPLKIPEMEIQPRSASAWQDLEKAWSSVGVLKQQLAKTQQKLDRASKGYMYSDPSLSVSVSSSTNSGKPLRTLKTLEPLKPSEMKTGFMKASDYQSLNVPNNNQSFLEDLPEKLPATTLARTSSSSSKDGCFEEFSYLKSAGLAKWTYNSGIPTWLQQKNLGSEQVAFSEWEKQFLLKELSDFGDSTSETNSEALCETKVCFVNDQKSVLQYQRTPVSSEQLRYISLPEAKSGLEKIKDLIERQKKDFTNRASVNVEEIQPPVEVFMTPRPNKSPDLDFKKEIFKSLEPNATDLLSEPHTECTSPKKVDVEIQTITHNVSRRVAAAPSIPIYRGFSAYGKINTKKILQEGKQVKEKPEGTSKENSNTINISPGKRIRKRKKSSKVANSNLITPATWREERALVLQKLGMVRVPGSPRTRVSQSSQVKKATFQEKNKEVHSLAGAELDRIKVATETRSAENKIAGSVRAVLKDLQSCDAEREDEASVQQPSSKKPRRIGSKKRKAVKQSELEQKAPAPKVRHYDPTVIRQYISKQKSERRKQMLEERQKTALVQERRFQQLQQLYAKQKITALASIKKPIQDNDNKKNESDMTTKPTSTSQSSHSEEEHMSSLYLETGPLSTSSDEKSPSANQVNDEQPVLIPQATDVRVECTSYQLPATVEEGSSDLLKYETLSKPEVLQAQQETFVPPVVKNLQTLATSIQSRIDEESRRLKALLEGVSSDNSSQCLTLPCESGSHVSEGESSSLNEESLPGIGALRGHQNKVYHQRLTQAAVKIQSVFRGYKARKEYRKLKENKMIGVSEEKDTDDSLSEGPLLSDNGKENCSSKRIIEAWQNNSEKTLKHEYSFDSNWNIARTPDPFNFISAWQQKQMFPLERIQNKTDHSFKLSLQLASKTSPDVEYSVAFSKSSEESSKTYIMSHASSESLSHNTSSSSLTVTEKINYSGSGGVSNSQDKIDEIPRICPSVEKLVSVAELEKDSAEKTVENSNETCLNKAVSRKDSYEELDVSDTLSEGSLSSSTLSEGRILTLNGSVPEESRKETSSSKTEDNELNPFSGAESKDKDGTQRSSVTSDAIIPTRNSVSVRNTMTPENHQDEVKEQDLSRLPPSSLGIRLSTELTYLDNINESLLQLSEVSRVHAISSVRQDVVSVANILEDVQKSHKKEHRKLHQEIQRQQHELDLIRHTQQQGLEHSTQRAFTESAQKLMNHQARAAVATAKAARELAKVKVTPLKEFGALWQQHSEGTTRLISSAAAAAAASAVTAVFEGQQKKLIAFREKPGSSNDKSSGHLSYTSDFEQVSPPPSKLENVSGKHHNGQLSGVSESVTERNRSKLSSISSTLEDREMRNDAAEHVPQRNHSKVSSSSENKGMSSDTIVSEHLHKEAEHIQPSAASYISEHISTVSEKDESSVSEHLSSFGEKIEKFISDHTLSQDDNRQLVTSRSKHKRTARSRSKIEDRSTEDTEQYKEGVPKPHSSKLLLPSKDHRNVSLSRNKPNSTSSTTSTSDQESQFSLGLLLDGDEKEGTVPSFFSEQSLTNFTVNMVRKLARDEELRARHQLALLQLQEKALVDKARSEMAWLELVKRNFRLKGSENKVPSIRKRQRGVLMKLKQERSEIQQLQQAHRTAAKNRREFLEQQEKVRESKSGVCQKEDKRLEEEVEVFSKKSRSSSNPESMDRSCIISKTKKTPSLNSGSSLSEHVSTESVAITEESVSEHVSTESIAVTEESMSEHISTESVAVTEESVSEHVSTESVAVTEESVSEHVSTESVAVAEESVSEHVSTESVAVTEESIKPGTEGHEISELSGSETPSLESVVEAICPTSSQTTSSKFSIPTSLKSEKRIEKPSERYKVAEKGAEKSLSRLKGSSDVSSKQTSHEGHLKVKAGKRYLTKREQNLHKRRKDLESLIKWQHQLDKQEAEVRELEKKALELLNTDRKTMATTEYSSTETKQPAETHDKTILNSTTVTTKQIQGSTSVSSKDDRKDRTRTSGSDSSVAEDLPLHDQPHMNSDSIMEKMIQCPSRTSPPYDKKHEAQNVTDVYSESFESVDNSMNSNPSAENMSKHGRKSEDVTGRHRSLGIVIRSPLVPRSHRRHDSSGSEDSLTISQSETASDQSDIEGRIFALKEELRHRRLEAERLKKEQKQIYRERLKEREESLKKQIEAYDKFIQKTQQDLDVELEASVLSGSSLTPLQIKPQIKQPRVAESRRLCKQLKLDKSQSSGEVSPVKLSVELTAVDDSKELRISKSEQELSYSRDEQKSTDSISSWSKSHQDNTGTVQSHFKDKQDGSGHTYGHEVKKTLGFEDEHKYKDVTSLNSSDEQEFSMCKEDSVVSELYVSKCKNTDSRSYSNKGDEGPSTSKDQFVLSETEEEVKETVPLCEVKFDKLVLSKSKGASVSRPEEQIGKLQHSESGSVSEITGSVPPGSTYQNRSSESESRSVPEITESVPPGSTYQNRRSESESRSVPEITGSVPSGSTYKGRNSELGSRSVHEITELVPSGTTYENRSSESESGSMPEITGSVHSDCIAKNRISESEYSEYKRVPDSTESVHSSSSAEEKSKDSNHSGPRHISEVTESVPSGSSAKNSISESKHSRAKSVPKVTESVPIDARALKIELNCPDLKASQATKHLPTELTSVQEVPGAENPEALVLKFADKKLVATEKEQDEGEQSLEETSGPGGNDSVSSISVISVGPSLQTGQGSSGEDSTQKRLYINLDNCSEFKKKSTQSNKSISVSLNHICTEEETVVRSESGSCVSVKQEPEAGISHEELVSSLRHEENREDGGTTLKPVSLRQSEVDLENCHVEENKCELPQVATNEEQDQVPYQTHQQQQLAESITTKLLITFIDDAVNVVHRIAAQQQHRQTETKRQHGVEAPRQVTGEDTIHEVKPKKEQRINGEQLERISHMLSNVLLEDALHTVIQIYCRPTVMVRCTHPRGESQTVSDQNVVSKKVNSILATLDCPRSPKERYRPQDLMVLSVVPDDIEDVQLGPVLNTFHTELFDEQEWFEDDLGLSSKERQDDQLLLQQQFLLEQYQQYFYQQIPNKPPPPYTPPQSTAPRSKVDLQRAAQPKAFSIVPQSYEEVKEITDKAANDVFEKLVLGHSLSDIHSNDQFEEEQNVEEITQLSQQSFETFIFSLVKEITADLYNIGKEEILPVWVRKRQLTPKPLLPSNARQFTTTVENCVAQKLGLNSCNKSTISSRCGFKKLVRKKTDFVDTILIQELREEEQEWVSYDEDEVTVKVQIASAIFNLLLEDTIHLAKRLFERTSHFLER